MEMIEQGRNSKKIRLGLTYGLLLGGFGLICLTGAWSLNHQEAQLFEPGQTDTGRVLIRILLGLACLATGAGIYYAWLLRRIRPTAGWPALLVGLPSLLLNLLMLFGPVLNPGPNFQALRHHAPVDPAREEFPVAEDSQPFAP